MVRKSQERNQHEEDKSNERGISVNERRKIVYELFNAVSPRQLTAGQRSPRTPRETASIYRPYCHLGFAIIMISTNKPYINPGIATTDKRHFARVM